MAQPLCWALLGLLAHLPAASGWDWCNARMEAFFHAALDRNGDALLSLTELHAMRSATAHSEAPPSHASDATAFMRSADTSPRDQSLGFWELCTALGDGAAASESGTANALDGQIHLALTGVSGEMRASFVTHAPLTGLANDTPCRARDAPARSH